MFDRNQPSRRALLRGALGLSAAAAAGSVLPPSTLAASRTGAAQPQIIDCATWGAAEPDAVLETLNYAPSNIVVHHMAFENTTDYSLEAAYAVAHRCQDLHMGNGWGDTGQQFSVSRGGYILEGRHGSLAAAQGGTSFVKGAQVADHNSETIGIENEGTYTSELPTEAQWNSLVDLLAYLCTQYGLPADAILGHRDFNPTTECPGQMLYDNLDKLRGEVATAMAGIA